MCVLKPEGDCSADSLSLTPRILGSFAFLGGVLWWGSTTKKRLQDQAAADRRIAEARSAAVLRQHALVEEVVQSLPGALWISNTDQDRDGTPRWVRQHTAALEGTDQVVGLVVDETAQRLREEAVRLEEQQAQRARHLESIGRLAGEAAHDTNNVLMIAQSMAQFAGKALPKAHPAQAELDEIGDICTRTGRRMHRLMAFTRQGVRPAEGTTQVLVLDDDANVRRLVCAVLSRAGFTPVPTDSAAEAIEIVSAAPSPCC